MQAQIAHFIDFAAFSEAECMTSFERYAAYGHRRRVLASGVALKIAFHPGLAEKIRKCADAAGVSVVGVHAPFGWEWDVLSSDREFAPVRRWVHRRLLKLLPEVFGIDTYVMHLLNDLYPGTVDEAVRDSESVLADLLEVASESKIVIALENGFQPIDYPDVLHRYVDRYKSPFIGSCFDIGHSNVISQRRGDTTDDYIKTLAASMVVCHLHDNDGSGDQHKVPGDGTIDWARYVPMLANAPRHPVLQNESHGVGYTSCALCRRFESLGFSGGGENYRVKLEI